ncbi:MAG: glycosyltransferase family 2 protein [Acidobacteriota bacterium]
MNPDISILIPTWNGLELLKQFLPSVIASAQWYEQTGAKTEILIIEDGGSDDTIAWLREQGFEECEGSLRFLRNEENLGFGKTCNRGFREARYPLVFLLNNDVEVDREAISPMAAHFSDPMVFAVHCRVFDFETRRECGRGQRGSFSKGFIRVHESYEPEEGREPSYSIFASGGSAMFDREKFLLAGAFDELLSPAYWEDVEVSYRAWKRGFTVLYEPRAAVYHRVSSTIRKLGSKKIRRIEQRNRLIYHWINLHDRRYFLSHLLWVALLALTAPLRFQPGFILSLASALARLPAIRRHRREEKLAAKRTDREVFRLFEK